MVDERSHATSAKLWQYEKHHVDMAQSPQHGLRPPLRNSSCAQHSFTCSAQQMPFHAAMVGAPEEEKDGQEGSGDKEKEKKARTQDKDSTQELHRSAWFVLRGAAPEIRGETGKGTATGRKKETAGGRIAALGAGPDADAELRAILEHLSSTQCKKFEIEIREAEHDQDKRLFPASWAEM
eukprot:5608799-Amphidinium_carterae.1